MSFYYCIFSVACLEEEKKNAQNGQKWSKITKKKINLRHILRYKHISVWHARKVFSWKLLENKQSRLISTQSVFVLHTNWLYLHFEGIWTHFRPNLLDLTSGNFLYFHDLRRCAFQVSNIFFRFSKNKKHGALRN